MTCNLKLLCSANYNVLFACSPANINTRSKSTIDAPEKCLKYVQSLQ